MIRLLPPRVVVHSDARGHTLSSPVSLPTPARDVCVWLLRWAEETPAAIFLAERDADGAWLQLSYAQVWQAVQAIGAGLLARGLTADRPVMILSENSVAAALLTLGAMQVGVPVSQVSAAYSLQSTHFHRLRAVYEQLRPGLVFVDDRPRYARALAALHGAELIDRDGLAALERTPTRAVAVIGADTIAKILFTSGSTGAPKGVVNTQRMLTANQESLAACWPFLADRRPVVVDWLPWSHTFGGNHNFFLVLRNGGSLYLDQGRPAPGLIERTLTNLAEVQPTLWFNVPRGFEQAVALLERDEGLARAVFARLDAVFYAAAALSPSTRARLEQVAARVGRPELFFTSAWGSTETAPLATSAHFLTRTTGILGLPVPGVELRLARVEDGYELRVRGPNVTPGFWRRGGGIEPVVLDEDGYLPTGDAGRFADDANPERGVVFVGRLTENFKLSSGTWVGVASLRLALIDAMQPFVAEVVIAGHDRACLGALLWLTPAGKAESNEALRAQLSAGLAAHNDAHPESSSRVARALILDDPLSLDEGEATDKGYTNQRRVLARRAAEVERLFAGPLEHNMITP